MLGLTWGVFFSLQKISLTLRLITWSQAELGSFMDEVKEFSWTTKITTIQRVIWASEVFLWRDFSRTRWSWINLPIGQNRINWMGFSWWTAPIIRIFHVVFAFLPVSYLLHNVDVNRSLFMWAYSKSQVFLLTSAKIYTTFSIYKLCFCALNT